MPSPIDVSYLSEAKARNGRGSRFFLSNNLPKFNNAPNELPKGSGVVYRKCTRIGTIMVPAVEAKGGTLYQMHDRSWAQIVIRRNGTSTSPNTYNDRQLYHM
eukprot:779676-Ditylum_brightwellii.AAC.1